MPTLIKLSWHLINLKSIGSKYENDVLKWLKTRQLQKILNLSYSGTFGWVNKLDCMFEIILTDYLFTKQQDPKHNKFKKIFPLLA